MGGVGVRRIALRRRESFLRPIEPDYGRAGPFAL